MITNEGIHQDLLTNYPDETKVWKPQKTSSYQRALLVQSWALLEVICCNIDLEMAATLKT